MKKNKWQNPLLSLIVASFLALLANAATENQEHVKDVSLSANQAGRHTSISLPTRVTKTVKNCSLASAKNRRLQRIKQQKHTTFVCSTTARGHTKTALSHHRTKHHEHKKHRHHTTASARPNRHHTSDGHSHHHHTKHASSKKHTVKKHATHKHISKTKHHASKKHQSSAKSNAAKKSKSTKKQSSKKHAASSKKHTTTTQLKQHYATTRTTTAARTMSTTATATTAATATATHTRLPLAAAVGGTVITADIAINFLATPTLSSTTWTVAPLATSVPTVADANSNTIDGTTAITNSESHETTTSDNNEEQNIDSEDSTENNAEENTENNEEDNDESSDENNEDENDEDEATAFSTGSGAADVNLNQPNADKSATASAQDIQNGKAIEATAQSKVIGISVGAVVGCLAAAGLVGMFMYRRHQKNHQEQDVEEMDAQSEVNTRYRTQSFMAVVAGTVAKLPSRSDSSSSKKSIGVLGSLRRAASRSLGRSNSTSSTQSYGIAYTGSSSPPPIARIDGDSPAQFYGADSPTNGPGHTHAY